MRYRAGRGMGSIRAMFTLAHLSDPHLGPLPRAGAHHFIGKRLLGYLNWYRRRGVHRPEALDAIVTDLHAQAPDHIGVTGDLVNLALPAEFGHALAWLRGLGDPADVSVVPGNHDAYVPLWRAQGVRLWSDFMRSSAAGAAFAATGEARFPYMRVFGPVALIGVSSARPTAPFVAAGRVGRAQLARLNRLLAAAGAAGLIRVMLIHHPPLPGMADWRRGLHDARALADVLKARGAELVLHGHLHKFTLTSVQGPRGRIPVVGAPSASAAASTSDPHAAHTRPAAAYHLYRIALVESGCVIEMTRRGLIEGGAQVGILGETRIFPALADADAPDLLGEHC